MLQHIINNKQLNLQRKMENKKERKNNKIADNIDTKDLPRYMMPATEEFSKKKHLERERLSNENLWIRVGTVFNIFMRPMFSGQIVISPRYICNNKGMFGSDNFSKIRKNMLVVYDRKTHNVQQDDLNIYIKDITIKATKNNEIHLMAPKMQKLILKENNITAKNTQVHCITTFRKTFLVHEKLLDCGEEANAWISKHSNNPNLALGYAAPQQHSKEIFWFDMRNLHMAEWDDRNIMIPSNILPRFTLISYRSFLEVNRSLDKPMTIDKYNADICVIPIDTEPFAELEWEWIQIDQVILRNITPWKRHTIKINLKDMPIEMQMNMIVLDFELYQHGSMQPGDGVFVRRRPRKNNSESYRLGF